MSNYNIKTAFVCLSSYAEMEDSMKGAKVIIKKELKRVFQDKKLIFSLFILPALVVIGIYALMGKLQSSLSDDIEQHLQKVYIKNAPEGLKDIIETTGYAELAEIEYLDNNADTSEIKAGILDGSIDLLVEFDAEFTEKVLAYSQAGDAIPQVIMNYNTTGNYSSVAKENFSYTVLNALSQSILAQRLGNLEILTAFETSDNIIVDEDKANGEMLSMMVPYLITFMLFAGAMSLGADSIAGEKERGTMASMLLSPISRGEIVIGKLVSLSILSIISAAVYAVSMIVTLPNTLASDADIKISFSVSQIVMLLIIMAVMVYLYVALVAFLSVLAKSVKEASTYVTPVYMIVLIAGMITMFQAGKEKPFFAYAIPVYGNALAIQNLMTNELTLSQFGMSIAGTAIIAVIMTVCMAKAFNSEKVMFNA